MSSYLLFRGSLTPETPEATRAADVAAVSAQTLGAHAANLFAGFTDYGLTIFDSGGDRYAQETASPGAGHATLISDYSCLDCEVSVTALSCTVVLRFDEATGSGYRFSTPTVGNVAVNAAFDGLSLSNIGAIGSKVDRTGVASIPGRGTPSFQDVWTFGYVGFEVYAKLNGVEFYREREFLIGNPGKVVIFVNNTFPALGDCSVTYSPQTMIGSNRRNNLFDIRDFGAKTTATTGSMTAGSAALTVASATGFAVGDHVTVAIGGEAALGARGTEGVGGSWPPTVYADATAMNADASKATNTVCWIRSTGRTYQWNGSAWATYNVSYYTDKANPLALEATILSIAGNVLTLDTPAIVATTSAAVTVNCNRAFFPMTDQGLSSYSLTRRIQIPAGNFSVSGNLTAGGSGLLTVSGRGKTVSKLTCPRGALPICMAIQGTTAVVRDFFVQGNHKKWTGGEVNGCHTLYSSTTSEYSGWPQAVEVRLATDPVVRNVDAADLLSTHVLFRQCTNGWGYNLQLDNSCGAEAYTQWYVTQVNSEGGGFVDCTVNGAVKLIKAFESFACGVDSNTGLGTTYLRCGGQNALFSSNSSAGLKLLEWDSTITEDSYGFLNAGYFGEGILNLNANAFHSAVDIYIRNPRIRQLGYCRSSDQTSMFAIQVSGDCSGVIIEGEYAGASTPFSSSLGGYISAPDWISGSGQSNGSVAIIDEGNNTIIRGVRATGATNSASHKSIENQSSPTPGTIQDCIADTFYFKTGTTKSGNRTNAGVSVP